MRATIPMQARKGRASYLGERSVGHQDPGATSTALILRALEAVVARRGLSHGTGPSGASRLTGRGRGPSPGPRAGTRGRSGDGSASTGGRPRLGLAQRALDAAPVEIEAIAARLWRSGRNAGGRDRRDRGLIARDPSLRPGGRQLIDERGVPAAAAILDACGGPRPDRSPRSTTPALPSGPTTSERGTAGGGILEGRRGGARGR